MPYSLHRSVVVLVAVASPALAQVSNGDFQTGVLSPWVVAGTPSGQSVSTSIATFDIDGAGPRVPSLAARVMAGQTGSNTGMQGVVIRQSVALETGVAYEVSVDWGVHALISTPVTAGRFEILIDGVPMTSADAPVLSANQRAYGSLGGQVQVGVGGVHELGVRITRNITAGAEVWQHIDNVSITPVCDGDVNCDFALDGFDVETQEKAVGGDTADYCQPDPDFNGDFALDGFDVEAVELVVGGGACP